MSAPVTFAEVRADVAAVMGVSEGGLLDDESLIDQGLDSVRLMTLIERWRMRGTSVSFADLAGRVTLREWREVIFGSPEDD